MPMREQHIGYRRSRRPRAARHRVRQGEERAVRRSRRDVSRQGPHPHEDCRVHPGRRHRLVDCRQRRQRHTGTSDNPRISGPRNRIRQSRQGDSEPREPRAGHRARGAVRGGHGVSVRTQGYHGVGRQGYGEASARAEVSYGSRPPTPAGMLT